MSSQLIGTFPVLAAARTTERFGVAGEIFLCTKNGFRTSSSKECFRSGGESGGEV